MTITVTLKSGDSCKFNVTNCYYEPKLKSLSFHEKEIDKVITIDMNVIERVYINEQ